MQKDDFMFAALNSDDGPLRSHYKRSIYYKEHFRYVEPVQISLVSSAQRKTSYFHYIPVRETLMAMMQDQSVYACLNNEMSSPKDVYGDVCDGEVFKKVSSTVTSKTCLHVILYQDAFEIVNPLGSAKKVHKILAVYMAVANLPCHVRTSIDNLQLVLLCKEKDLNSFGQDQIFDCLIKDLKMLETDGLLVNTVKVEFRLTCFLGDNLGSHWLGGFFTNFSSNSFICRYCLVRKEKNNLNSICCTDEIRTPSNYSECVALASSDLPCKGIVKESVLNQLQYFHVCTPGLPPCLGHDLFEGVVQYDLALILKHLCKTGVTTMSIKYLNREIQTFSFIGNDARDKPGIVSDGKTVGGHAVQNWCLLRLLPLFLFTVVNVDDDAWRLLLLLREIVELVCAPKISKNQILYLNRLVKLYLEDRVHLFPDCPVRPKHHYLLHYLG
jgi:adenosine/AMP kinase